MLPTLIHLTGVLTAIASALLLPLASSAIAEPTPTEISPIEDSPISEDPLYDEPTYPNACEFTVNISAGSLADNEFYGEFRFDSANLTGQGEETITPADGLQISMHYLGRTYTETSDRNHPDYPRVILEDGKVKLVDFWVDPRDRGIWWTGVPGWDVQLTQTDCELSSQSDDED